MLPCRSHGHMFRSPPPLDHGLVHSLYVPLSGSPPGFLMTLLYRCPRYPLFLSCSSVLVPPVINLCPCPPLRHLFLCPMSLCSRLCAALSLSLCSTLLVLSSWSSDFVSVSEGLLGWGIRWTLNRSCLGLDGVDRKVLSYIHSLAKQYTIPSHPLGRASADTSYQEHSHTYEREPYYAVHFAGRQVVARLLTTWAPRLTGQRVSLGSTPY